KTTDKKPAVNFYRRWQKAFTPFVQSNGEIKLPTMQEYLAKIDERNQPQKLVNTAKTAMGTSANRWRNIGPNSTWDFKSGRPSKDYQACVYRLDVAESDNNILYSGAETGMVFKTTDKGKNWKPCKGDHDFGGGIYAIKIDPKNPDIVYVGGGSVLWKSTDGGDSWERLQGVASRVNSIRISKNNSDNITVASADGFFVSNDGGNTFNKTIDGLCHDHEIQPGNENKIYLLIKKSGDEKFSFMISEDGGQNFIESKIINNIVAGRLAVSEAPNGQDYVYALVNVNWESGTGGHYLYGGGGTPYIFQSKDAGKTWTDKTTREDANSWSNTFCPIIDNQQGGQGYFDMMIGASNKNPEHVIYGLTSAYRSTNGGAGSFRSNGLGGYCGRFSIHADMQDIAIVGNDTWISTDGGIKYSSDFFETEGQDRNNGFYASDYHGFGQGWNEDVIAGGRWHNGDAVQVASYGEGKNIWVGGVEYATGYVMLSNPYKTYFSDAGMHTMPKNFTGTVVDDYQTYFVDWKEGGKKPYERLKENGYIVTDPRYAQRIIINPKDADDRDKIYVSKNEGKSFTMMADLDYQAMSNFAFSRSNPDYIYVCGIYDIFRSIDNGKTWNELKNRPFASSDYFTGNPGSFLAIHPKDENTVWVAKPNFGGRVVYTKDGGETWTNVLQNTRLKDTRIRWIVLVGDSKNGVYLGSEDGAKVYYKDDELSDWVDYSTGLPPNVRLTKIDPFYKDGKLRAATSQGIWEIPLYKQNFEPTAQPMALNLAEALLSDPNMEVQFDSYSIINQDGAKWEWSFSPEPKSVNNKNIRNPKVVFAYNGEYDVTLKVTTKEGLSHSKTINKMVIVNNGVLSTTEATKNDVVLAPTLAKAGEELKLSVPKDLKKMKFFIYDAKGGLVKTMDLKSGENVYSISTQGLTTGVYMYQLKSETTKHFGRFIIK
ncbi:MAG: hypothetical protein Q4G16_10815, partial [Cruoricaptor ignavus]|nr:hypothetical protein [Cruoricaptor ignavus]